MAGGGAAGFFSAIAAAEANPGATVMLYERSNKLLSKVLVSGGGRCNVTHACFDNNILVQHYPRGSRELRGPFEQFTTSDTVKWFEARGVKLKTEADGRMFPVTDNSETIAHCLLQAAQQLGIKIKTSLGVQKIIPEDGQYRLIFNESYEEIFDKVIIAAGGGPKLSSYQWLSELGLEIAPPVPSLFTFNIYDEELHALAGISVPEAEITVAGTPLKQAGPLLITHWGLSGPAVLKLSAWGARILYDKDYNFTAKISWLPGAKEEPLRESLNQTKNTDARKTTGAGNSFGFPARLWKWMLKKSGISEEMKWADVSKKQLNALTENLLRMPLPVEGKSTFKEEFVTAGGVSLKELNLKTMESKKHPGLYFCGEIIDIDGITGGFNFQAAWTGGYIAGKNAGQV